jgi:coenzyme F420 hydrogenase subunit beta
MTNGKTIGSVVEDGLCAQCGWCVVSCPSAAITQRETPAGHLMPEIDEEKCTHCGTCHRNCSGWHLEEGLLDAASDLLEGPILATFVGHAADPELRSKAQSGGIVSAILCHQLESGNISRALVTEMPADGSLRPCAFLAQTREQVLRARGSKYCPVRYDSLLSSGFKGLDSAAIVGTSCQIQTVCNANKHHTSRVSLMIGLFCDRIFSHCAIDYFLEAANVRRKDVSSIRFKDRSHGPFPGDIRIERGKSDPVYLSNDIRLDIKPVCTPNRCRLCFDKLNVLADIAVGDTWGIAFSKEGLSAILVRTQRGFDALCAAESAGAIVINSVLPQSIFRGQQVEKRRQDWATYTAAWEKLGRTAPEIPIKRNYRASSERARQLQKKMREMRRADFLAGQPNREAALKEAMRQLALQNIKNWLNGNDLRRTAARRLKSLRNLIDKSNAKA